jgi:hypothetical protein
MALLQILLVMLLMLAGISRWIAVHNAEHFTEQQAWGYDKGFLLAWVSLGIPGMAAATLLPMSIEEWTMVVATWLLCFFVLWRIEHLYNPHTKQ